MHFVVYLLGLIGVSRAAENGLARTPQMGWNTWNRFGCRIDEDLIHASAKAVVSTGLRDVGYKYVLIDDCWQADSREKGTNKPLAHPKRFPNGIKRLSKKVHDLDLKIGIYSSAGVYTCARRFGSLDYEEIDAKAYAEWEVDYLKYDNCFNQGRSGTPLISFQRYANMSRALNATGRPILYSMCNWGEDGPWNWATEIANSWRMSGDIKDATMIVVRARVCLIASLLDIVHCTVTRILDFAAPLGQKSGPGRWNDLDMLEVGNGGMSYNEYVTHFTMWAVFKSPLILGNDLTRMSHETLEIVTNQAVIAVNQDRKGAPAARIWKREVKGGDAQLWSTRLANGTTAIALVNTSPYPLRIVLPFADVFRDARPAARKASYRLYDLWAQKTTQPPTWSSVSSKFPSFATSLGASNSTLKNILARSTNWGKDLGVHTCSLKEVDIPAHGVRLWLAEADAVAPSGVECAMSQAIEVVGRLPRPGFATETITVGYKLPIIFLALVIFLCLPPVRARLFSSNRERYGLAPGKTLNLNLTTPDDVRLGAWFVAADGFYQKHLKPLSPTKLDRAHVTDGQDATDDGQTSSPGHRIAYHPRDKLASMLPLAIQAHPTVLFFHGNAMSRAFHMRTRLYSVLTSRLNANVLVIDYRGFGDSGGTPSEKGLLVDARTAWDWLIENGAKEEDITVLGQSLGTAVAARLVAELAEEGSAADDTRPGVSPRGVVLLAPYSSIAKLLETYNLGGRLPVLQPLQSFRFVFDIVIKFLRHRFDTLSIINDISCPVTIVHATDDWDIPVSHAKALFDSLLEPLLPAYPFDSNEMFLGKIPHSEILKIVEARNARREELIAATEIEGLGTVRRFERGKDKSSVVMLETTWGGHNGLTEIEGVIDVVGWSVGMGEQD
ncbi:hypothetical protein FRC06_002417 [Ceratobasidium sp. 370]|nr:hypothetical protein FRC06_002417 [Ceratobasidium sp. 370]